MSLAKAGKTAEASVALAKLAEKPGVVGKFLQSARIWAPKVASKVDKLPGGVLKGFKKTIIDYLKLLENAGAKSVKFQKATGNLAKYIGNAAKPAENIKALQSLLKDEKIFSGLAKKGPLANIFLGGAPRLFGDRRMRILMRQTKWWLGFLDYIGVANFVGPDELVSQMGEIDVKQKMAQYNQTPEAQQYSNEDFGGAKNMNDETTSQTSSNKGTNNKSTSDPIQSMLSTLFGGQLKNAISLAI
jgi:hypothetical protein